MDAWKFLDLELNAPPASRTPSIPRTTLEIDGEDIPAAPRDPSPSRRDPPRRGRDDDDMFSCKVCGRRCRIDASRCSHCGERFESDEDHPRRRRPRRDDRRDTEPHRAGLVLSMGIVSLVLLAFCPLLSVIPGMIAWICGRSDLRKMRDETMDPDGEGSTQAGWICGIIGTGLSVVVWLGCSGFFGMIWYEQIESSRRTNQPRFNAPPPRPVQKF